MAYTVNKTVLSGGRPRHPGDILPDELAAIIDPEHLVEVPDVDPDPNEADEVDEDEDEHDWYDGRTVGSVLEGVGDDPARREIAIAFELERPNPRAGVLDKLGHSTE